MEVYGGKISIRHTKDFTETLKEEYGYYDTTDCFFDEKPNIRVFVKQSSVFMDLPDTLFYYRDGELIDILSGKVLIAKDRYSHFGPLSDKDIRFIIKKLITGNNNSFNIYY